MLTQLCGALRRFRIVYFLATFSALAIVSPQAALAQFTQQGNKLVGNGAIGNPNQGSSSAISADGNTAIVGGANDDSGKGAAWIYSRINGVWSQQGAKVVGTNMIGSAEQGFAVAMSADGNTAAIGGYADNSNAGAVWVFGRINGVWTQQGNKLTPTGATGAATYFGYGLSMSGDGNSLLVGAPVDNNSIGASYIFTRSGGVWSQLNGKLVGTGSAGISPNQGAAVSISGDGNTAMVGGFNDTSNAGAIWIFAKANGVWSQQGQKLKGNDAVGAALQGNSVSLSSDGNTAAWGGYGDSSGKGAVWIFTRTSGVWTQQGAKLVGTGGIGNSAQGSSTSLSGDGMNLISGGYNDNNGIGAFWSFARAGTTWTQLGTKLVGTGNVGTAIEGWSAALSSDGGTAVIGGRGDNSDKGAAWIFTRPAIGVSPTTAIAASGNVGGPFSPPSFDYVVKASSGDVMYTVSGVPAWLTASSTSGSIASDSSKTINFTVNASANAMAVGTYGPTVITVANSTNGIGASLISATLTVGTPGAVSVVSAVLPASRSVQIGATATAFATIINTSGNVGTNCSLSLGSNIPGSFRFQTTDSASNALTGTINTPINIPANGVQSFVFAITPTAAFDPTDVPITAGCSNGTAATSVVGLNTLLFSASTTPVADLVALAATASNDGIINVPGTSGTGAFAVATVNLGIVSAVAVTADTGAATLPIDLSLCQTNPVTGQCTTPIGPAVVTIVGANETPTFAIFAKGNGNIAFDPANSRVFVRFKDGAGVTRGATSVAVRTQ